MSSNLTLYFGNIAIVNDEKLIQKRWEKEKVFEQSLILNENYVPIWDAKYNNSNNVYIFYDGPPFATGTPHYGHILTGSIKDTVGRYQTQMGYNVPRRFGWDCHGLPIEYVIDKKYDIKNKYEIEEVWGLTKYNNACSEIVMECASEWETTMTRLARWVDFKNDYKTMDFDFMNSVWWVFSELAKNDYVYSSYRVMPYSVSCTTPLSNFETQQNYKEVDDIVIFVNFSLVEQFDNKEVSLLVWTTTPWTLPSNLAIAINSQISYSLIESNGEFFIIGTNLLVKVFGMVKRDYKIIIQTIDVNSLIGLKYMPLFESYKLETLDTESRKRAFTIVSADFITETDGTGIVHIAPSFGEDDYQTCIVNKIISKTDELFMSINDNGFFIDNLKTLEDIGGLIYKNTDYVKSKDITDIYIDANSAIIQKLKDSNKLFHKYKYIHNNPFCWRSDTPLIYRAIKSWFVNVEKIKDNMVELNKGINWVPDNIGSNRFHQWLTNAKDWCIARSRYWGTPIPIWQNVKNPLDYKVISSSMEIEFLCGLEKNSIKNLHRDHIDNLTFELNGSTYKRITDVFDCWFESGSMPVASIGYPYKTTPEQNPVFVADFIAEGIDQTRGWFYTMLVISTALFNKAPFKNVIVNGLVLASDGKKMSKRLKNYPDPNEVVEIYGADALRLYLIGSPASKGEDLKFNEEGLRQMVGDIIIPMKNVIEFFEVYKKMLNIKFPEAELLNVENYNTENSLDLYAIHYIGGYIMEINQDLFKYQLSDAVKKLFTLVKMLTNQFLKYNRFSLKGKNGREPWISSLSTMKILLNYMAVNIACLMPYFSEYIFNKLDNSAKSVHLTRFYEVLLPKLDKDKIKISYDMLHVFDVINLLNEIRQKNDINIKIPLERFLLKSTPEICEIIQNNRNLILNELNILELETLPYTNADIKINIDTPHFKNIKSVHLKNMKKILDILNLNKLNNEQINELAIEKKAIQAFGFEITPDMVESFKIQPIEIPGYTSGYSNINNTSYCAYLCSFMSEKANKIVYAKIIANAFQRMRKTACLYPWNKIKLAYLGIGEYDLQDDIVRQKIFEICEYELIEYDSNITKDNIIFKAKIYQNGCNLDTFPIGTENDDKSILKAILFQNREPYEKNLKLFIIRDI